MMLFEATKATGCAMVGNPQAQCLIWHGHRGLILQYRMGKLGRTYKVTDEGLLDDVRGWLPCSVYHGLIVQAAIVLDQPVVAEGPLSSILEEGVAAWVRCPGTRGEGHAWDGNKLMECPLDARALFDRGWKRLRIPGMELVT